jgi:hypothetical protein
MTKIKWVDHIMTMATRVCGYHCIDASIFNRYDEDERRVYSALLAAGYLVIEETRTWVCTEDQSIKGTYIRASATELGRDLWSSGKLSI